MGGNKLVELAMPKRVKLSEGDVFELSLPDGHLGYGIIVRRGTLAGGGTPYVALFRSTYDSRPDLAEITDDDVALAGWTTDALVYHDRWKVIGNSATRPEVPFPSFKVEMDGKSYVTDVEGELIREATESERALLDYWFSRSAIGFQNAFEALQGFGEWRDDYEKLTPAHARARATR